MRTWHRRSSLGMVNFLFCLFPAHLAAPHPPQPVELAQLSLDRLTLEQRNEPHSHLFYLAHFDARLENCGFHSNVERRSIAAARDCMRPESLTSLISFYRAQKAATFKVIAESQNGPEKKRIDCSKPTEKAWLETLKPIIENHVRELDRMCRACTFC